MRISKLMMLCQENCDQMASGIDIHISSILYQNVNRLNHIFDLFFTTVSGYMYQSLCKVGIDMPISFFVGVRYSTS